MKYLIFIVVVFVAVSGFFAWRSYDANAKAANREAEILKEVSGDDLKAVLASQPETAPLLNDEESRRLFLKGLHEYLALSAQARREGLADDQLFKTNFEYKKMILIAEAYERRLAYDPAAPKVTEEEMQAVWADPENEKLFSETTSAISTIQRAAERQRGSEAPIPALTGEALEKSRGRWARSKVYYTKAMADQDFMNSREVQLRVKFLEAGILSADYLRKYWPSEIKATDSEIESYLNLHPELREGVKKQKANAILSRVLAGEDMAVIAKNESEDRPSREKGGLYENLEPDYVWQEVEKAALSLEPGKIFPTLVESNTGYHIVKLEKKTAFKKPDGTTGYRFSFRHILIQRAFEDPNHHMTGVPAPFVDSRSIATKAIESEKRDKFVKDVIAKAGVSLPEDI